MRIIPVIDVMNGIVVRAVAGRRVEYRPVVSRLTKSTDPIEVARAMLDATGAKELYVADLDSIRDSDRPSSIAQDLTEQFPRTTIFGDAGVSLAVLQSASTARNIRPVLGTESVRCLDELELFIRSSSSNFAVSFDLNGGEWVGDREVWQPCGVGPATNLGRVLTLLVERMTPRHLIMLDVARVGTYSSSGMEGLIEFARTVHPRDLIVGGGVGGWDDVKRLEDAGADAVLVASALHDGRLP